MGPCKPWVVAGLLLLVSIASAMYIPPPGQDEAYVAMCLVVKNQIYEAIEFVKYHSYIGVRKFYIYDHGSTPPLFQFLAPYIQTGLVEYKYFVGHHHVKPVKVFEQTGQGYAYTECIASAKLRHKWLAFIDADEFLVIKDPASTTLDLNAFLTQYEEYGGLGVNWVTFGSSGHLTKPVGSTLTQYTKCLPGSHPNELHIKSIANTRYLAGISHNPHCFLYTDNKTTINEHFVPITDAFTKEHSTDKIALHHYTVKSLEDYQRKMARGGGSGAVKTMNFFTQVDKLATETCTAAVAAGHNCCED